MTSKKPSQPTTNKISMLQFERMQRSINSLRRSDKAQVYMNGVLMQDCSEESVKFLKLTGEEDSAQIEEYDYPTYSLFKNSGFSRSTSTEVVQATAQHVVCDLYRKACELFPGFQKVSNRPVQIKQHKSVAPVSPAPIPWDGSEPAIEFKESDFMRRSSMKPSKLMLALGLGGTGSGKTHSFGRPLLDAMLHYRLPDGKTYSILVVDPKAELLTSVTKTLEQLNERERLLVLGQCPPISYFSDSDSYSTSDRFEKLSSFAGGSPANKDDDKWHRFALNLIQSFLLDDQSFFDVTELPLLECVCALVHADKRYVKMSQWRALREILQYAMNGPSALKHLSDCYEVLVHCAGVQDLARPLMRYLSMNGDGLDQWFYNARGALAVVEPLASEDIENLIDLSVRRGVARTHSTSLVDVINRGQVLVYQPMDRASHDLAGKALKALFFQTVMSREDMLRPIGYVCDEWQRFITVDHESGDHNFFDRCRAYRVTAVVVTQSVSALQIALGSDNQARDAVKSLLINLPTKVVFRTSCVDTSDSVQGFIPSDPGGDVHILKCRPISNLATGEYYFMNADGWGRSRHILPKKAA